MNFQRLIDRLPDLYQNWGVSAAYPASAQFELSLAQSGLVQSGLTQSGTVPNAAIMPLLNEAVGCMAPGEVYCEVGCLEGANIIAALRGHGDRMAYAVESPARLDPQGAMVDRLLENLTTFHLEEQVLFCAQDTEDFFADLSATGLDDRIGVYFYNGASDYRSQFLALMLAKPFLAEQALIILAQAELGTVRQAAWDFLTAYPQAQLLLDLTEQRGYPASGSGLLLLGWDSEASSGAIASDAQRRELNVIHAISSLEQHQQFTKLEILRNEAAQRVVEGRLDAAEEAYQKILLYDKSNAEVWQNLGMVHYLLGQNELALDALRTALNLNPHNPVACQILGLALERTGQLEDAAEAYQQAIALNPNYANALNSLGELRLRQGSLDEAEKLFRQAIAAAPDWSISYVNLGDVLMKQEQRQTAIAEYRKAINLDRQNPNIWQRLADAYRIEGDFKREKFCTIYSLYFQNDHEEAIEQFQAHFSIEQLETVSECLVLYDSYFQCGLTEQVIQCAQRAAQLRSEDAFLQILPDLVLPILYQSTEEIAFYRQRYLEGCNRLSRQIEEARSQGKSINFQALENFTNFYISYQGFNDRSIQRIYGNLRHQLMTERYPSLVQPMAMPPIGKNGKIRIGYIAESLGNNSETRWAVGWLKNHDRSQFEIYCYSIDANTDLRTEQFRLLSDVFYQLPNDPNAIGERIRADQLHILVFLALGTRVRIKAIASLRLAPVQCSAWGHPVTSGLPTIDYFLSSELMEPDNAQEHYSEQLVRLPNIGLCYPKPVFPEATKRRADFGLREDAVLYLSCQLMFKYLPQHDYLLVEIARRVPDAQIVFVLRSTPRGSVNPRLMQQFRQRLQRAFADAGLRMEDYCVFLPGQDLQGYASLLACTDIFLDTLGFSGGHTTLEAIAAGLPVVCCPGELMRGRQSAGILRMLGVTDTIAQTEAEYIDIAVKLGLETDWRQAISQRIWECQSNLFEDVACVAGLEQFYRQIVQEQLLQQEKTSQEWLNMQTTATKLILHVGCGPYDPEALPKPFRTSEWREVRLDLNPAVQPDIVGSITDLSAVPDQSMDAVYSSHNLEHVYAHEVPIALGEFYRVLKPGGRVLISVPDIQEVAEHVATGNLEEPLYESPAGPISAIDILYGLRTAIAGGNHFMAHRTAFTSESLSQKLKQAGFSKVNIQKGNLNIWAVGYK